MDSRLIIGVVMMGAFLLFSVIMIVSASRKGAFKSHGRVNLEISSAIDEESESGVSSIRTIYNLLMGKLFLAGLIIPLTIISNSFQEKYLVVYSVAIGLSILSVVWYVKSFRKYSTPYDSVWQKFKLCVMLLRYGTPNPHHRLI